MKHPSKEKILRRQRLVAVSKKVQRAQIRRAAKLVISVADARDGL